VTPKVHPVAGTEGPPILLLHGFGSDRSSWLANQQELAVAGRVYALDLPGHGETPPVGAGRLSDLAAAVERALEGSGIGQVDVVAHSLGGAVAILLAATRPDRIRSLALIAPPGLCGEVDAAFLAQFPQADSFEEIDALLKRLVSRPRLINRFMVARVRAQLQKPGAREALAAIARDLGRIGAVLEPSIQAVADSALPRLTIWGELDAIVALDRDRLAAFGGETLVLADAAHLPHVESARAVNERVVRWLTERR